MLNSFGSAAGIKFHRGRANKTIFDFIQLTSLELIAGRKMVDLDKYKFVKSQSREGLPDNQQKREIYLKFLALSESNFSSNGMFKGEKSLAEMSF
jgi:hypothetical protein